jgi:hypothetical protein
MKATEMNMMWDPLMKFVRGCGASAGLVVLFDGVARLHFGYVLFVSPAKVRFHWK